MNEILLASKDFFYFFLENHEDLPTAATTFTQTNIRLWNEVNNEIKTI